MKAKKTLTIKCKKTLLARIETANIACYVQGLLKLRRDEHLITGGSLTEIHRSIAKIKNAFRN